MRRRRLEAEQRAEGVEAGWLDRSTAARPWRTSDGIDATWISAGASILVALVRRDAGRPRVPGARARARPPSGGLSREGATRLRFVRRLLYAAIILIGIAVALSGFTGISKLATSLLASGAIAAAIIGFAARQTLANFVAGIMLAITQPIRVGDWVTFEGNYGVVEDVRLNYTILRTRVRAADRDPEREARRRGHEERHAGDRRGRARRVDLDPARGRRRARDRGARRTRPGRR